MGDQGQGTQKLWLIAGLVVVVGAVAWLAPGTKDASPPSAADAQQSDDDPAQLPPILVLLDPSARRRDSDELALAVREADRIRSARALIALADQLDPELVDPERAPAVWLARGRAYETQGDLPEARLAYEKVSPEHWAHPYARLGLGRILAQAGDPEGARAHLQAAIDAGGPTETAARLAMGAAFLADGKPDQAMWTWRRAKVRSASYDTMRMKTRRLKVRHHQATWRPVLAEVERLLGLDDPYEATLVSPGKTNPIVRQRLLADPGLIELEAERQALVALGSQAEPEPLVRASHAAHREAAIRATRRLLDELGNEVRRSLP